MVEDGEIHALTKRKAEVPAEVATFMRLPGLGPKTARRIWQELGITTVDALRAAAEAQQLRGARRARREVGGEDPRRARQAARGRGPAAARCSGTRCRSCAPSRRELAAHPAAVQVSIAGLGAPLPRDRARPRPDRDRDRRGGAARRVLLAAVGRRGRREGADEGDRRRAGRAAASTCASCRRSRTATCSSTSPARRTHNVALREAAVRRGLSVSEYGIAEVESGEVHAFATEEEVYAFLGYAWIPPELRENCGELEAARNGELPKLVELARPARRPAHAHDLVGRQGLARGDGRRARSRRATSTTRSATTRSGCATAGSQQQAAAIDALQRARAGADPEGDRGEHPRRRRARRLRRGPRDARLGRRVGAQRASTRTPTERVLAAMENPYVDCIGHLTSRKIGRRDAGAASTSSA